jgi:hypothetical protein
MTHQSLVTGSLSRPGGAYSHVTSIDRLVFTAGFGGILVEIDVVAGTPRQ